MRFWRVAIATGVALVLAGGARAGSLSLVGQLDPGNAQYDAFLFTFTLSAPDAVSIQSWGYGGTSGAPGGTNAAGNPIAAGGFDPYVTLFAGSGPGATFVASSDDGSCPPGTIADALCGDPTLTVPLAAGTYTLAVSAFFNLSFAENLGSGTLGDGFVGLGSFGARTNTYAVDVSGNAVVLPTLLLGYAPNGITFGAQTVGVASGPLSVTVTNVGTGIVTLGSPAIGGTNAGDFSAGGSCGGTLLPGASCSVGVVFTPAATGARSATVALASNAANAPIVFAVGGMGTTDPVAIASLGASSLDFGSRGLNSSTQLPLVVTNTGGAMLNVASVALAGANPGEYSLADGCSGQAVPSASTCMIWVTFSPSAYGARTATATIASNASNSPTTVLLTGFVPVPRAEAIPAVGLAGLLLLSTLLATSGGIARRCSRNDSETRIG